MNVYFKPWIGCNFSSKKPKILVVGDSHYCGDECSENCGIRSKGPIEEFGCSNFTKDIVKEYINFRKGVGKKEDWMTRTFLRFDKIFYGKEDVSVDESIQLWESIVYYVFVQTAKSSTPSNTNYSAEDYADSSLMALDVIKEFRPDIVIIWGNRAYESFSDEGWHNFENNISGYYELNDGHKAYCIKINHPSRAIVEDWHNILNEFIKSNVE